MKDFDQLHRYLFGEANVRGELVRLQQSYQSILDASEYPAPIQKLLGELMAATCLLTATLKFEGDIAVQVQSEGPVKYAVINGSHEQNMRGIARWEGDVPDDFSQMFEKGLLVITISPNEGDRYQGMVALEKDTLAECLQDYFTQSEQLPTKVQLYAQPEQQLAAGMLLQVLPAAPKNSSDDFAHLSTLTETVTEEEIFSLPTEELLYRLYHQEEVELMPAQSVQFKCTCSKERSASALLSVDKAELLDIVAQEGDIRMNCQYCHQEYRFDAIDVEAIHAGRYPSSGVAN